MDDPISVLHLYGLEQVLTDQDDPCLWASALNKHWPRPDDSKLWDEDDNPFLALIPVAIREKLKERHMEILLFGGFTETFSWKPPDSKKSFFEKGKNGIET